MKKDSYNPIDSSYKVGDSLLFWAFFGVLSTYVIEGLLRYLLVTVGLPNAIYLRDAVAVGTVAFIFFRSLLFQGWIEPHVALVCCVLLFHLLVGLFSGIPLFQTLFGLKILVPLVFGLALSPILARNFSRLLIFMAIFFFISITGVYINYFLEKMPWEGMEYYTALGTPTGTTREWWATGGLRRLPGFARTSFNAAMIVGISGFACMLLFKRTMLRLVVVVIALTAIILTTTKSMSQVFMIITLWMLFRKTPIFFPMGRLLVVTFLVLAIALPTVVVFFDLSYGVMEKDVPNLLRSLWDRFSWMWPEAFDLMTKPEHYVFGKGLGAIGTAQSYGDSYVVPNAADNIFVYSFVLFGPLSLLYLSYPVWCVLRLPNRDNMTVWCIGLLIICYDYGLTINMVEEPFFSALFGMVFGVGWKSIKNNGISRSNQNREVYAKACFQSVKQRGSQS